MRNTTGCICPKTWDTVTVQNHGIDLEAWQSTRCEIENSCCMKRKLILAMTNKILRWLKRNKGNIKDIDFNDKCIVGDKKLTEDVHCDTESSVSASDADIVKQFHPMNEIAKIGISTNGQGRYSSGMGFSVFS